MECADLRFFLEFVREGWRNSRRILKNTVITNFFRASDVLDSAKCSASNTNEVVVLVHFILKKLRF